ncbi:hypothetical protein GCM10027164_17070 [Algoriphagus taiwanensis]
MNLQAQEIPKENLPDSVTVNFNFSPFRKTPDTTGEVISRLKIGTKARLLDIEKDHVKVRINNEIGYISQAFIDKPSPLKEYFDQYKIFIAEQEKQRKIREQEIKDSIYQENLKVQDAKLKAYREARKKELIKKYGPTSGEKVFNKLIWIGMTEEMLLDSWGSPNDINRTVTSSLVRKQYVYSGGRYVYVENGKVVAWQD